jgi:transcription elongation factor GreA
MFFAPRSYWRCQCYDHYSKRSRAGAFSTLLGNDMSAIPLTVRGAERLSEELHRLKTIERPSVINAIAEARAQGDLSENAEYDAARERQGFIEGRIAELEGTLSNAHVINPMELDADGRAVFGATVEIEDLDSGDRVVYQKATSSRCRRRRARASSKYSACDICKSDGKSPGAGPVRIAG